MNENERKEMDDLRKAITTNPASVHVSCQERFSELFVQSLEWVQSPSGGLDSGVTE